MIDLRALRDAADRADAGDTAIVTRRWLKEVADEIAACRTHRALQRAQDVASAALLGEK